MEKEFTIAEDQAGQRTDRFLAEATGAARHQVQNAIENGEVTVNGKVAKASLRLRAGDRIELQREIADPTDLPKLRPQPDLPVRVIHEDDQIAVLEKPTGMLMHPARAEDEGTLANFLVGRYPEIAGVGESEWRPGIMQRLDKDASGIVVAARTQKAYDSLKRQFQAHDILKEYEVLAEGEMAKDSGTVDRPIGRAKGSGRMSAHSQAAEKDKPAVTHYEVIGRPPKSTLLAVRTETGRTHQIRVHLRSLGHPIVGDTLYGKKDGLKSDRLCLHAKRLGFRHPESGEWREFECLPPAWPAVAKSGSGR